MNAINKLKNKLIIFTLLLSLSFLSACSNNVSNESKEKYDKAITSFHTDSEAVYNASILILTQYSEFWNAGIGKGKMFEYVQVAKDNNENLIYETNKIFESTSQNIKVLSEAAKENPEQYEEIYTESKKLYETLSALMEQVNNPSGSYITFNQNVNTLLQDFEINHNLIGLLISEDEKEVDVKDNEL